MLIRCPQCSAGYDFPVEQLPPAGLKAKCARCGFVMLVKPDVGAVDPISGLPEKPFERRAGGEEETVKVAPREEREVDDGPSVVIDIGQLADAPEPAADEPPPIDLAAFAPLSAPPPVDTSAPSRPRAPAHFPGPVQEVADVKEVRPPGMWRLVVLFLALVVGAFVLLVGVRSDWQVDWTDPDALREAAFGVKERTRVEPPSTVASVVKVEGVRGELQLADLTATRLPGGAAWVQGQIINGSNRRQRGIGLEVRVESADGVALKARTVPCCDGFDAETAKAVAGDRAHPHFSTSFNRAAEVRLAPGERRAFSVVVLDVPGRGPIQASGRIKFSEFEAPDAAPSP